MKRISVFYWIVTILFAGFMIFTAIPDVLVSKEAVDFIRQIGYPVYFIPFIGAVKILGGAAILIPGFPVIKEWAYAGLMYDLIGAAYSVACVFGAGPALPMLLFIAFGFASYVLYRKRKSLQGTVT